MVVWAEQSLEALLVQTRPAVPAAVFMCILVAHDHKWN